MGPAEQVTDDDVQVMAALIRLGSHKSRYEAVLHAIDEHMGTTDWPQGDWNTSKVWITLNRIYQVAFQTDEEPWSE